MKVHYGNKLLTAALAILLSNQHAKAAQEINAADFIKQLPAISASTQSGLEPAYSSEGLGSGTMWQQWRPNFTGAIRPDSDFITAVIALRQPKTRSKTDFSRDIFTHITITILAQRGIEGISLGMLSDTSNMGRHVRAIQRALEWNNADMQAVMEALGYTNIIHLHDGIDFKDETSQVRQDVKRLVNNVVERPIQELERFAKKAFRW